MAGPITATLDALTAGNLGMLQLLRARELMQENIESRRHLEQQAYEALRSWRTTVLIAPVLNLRWRRAERRKGRHPVRTGLARQHARV